ncbi:MAG: hypothetical protein IPK68_12820 [Bdellovibrionales bacterium]|nr:hypothetical protein [Bdellovibrionales bacterium]
MVMIIHIEVNMILKPFGIFRCTSGFTDEPIDIGSEHGVGVIKMICRSARFPIIKLDLSEWLELIKILLIFDHRPIGKRKKLSNDGGATDFQEFTHPPLLDSRAEEDLNINKAVGPQAFGESVVSKRHGVLAEANLRISGSSSAWCSAHQRERCCRTHV